MDLSDTNEINIDDDIKNNLSDNDAKNDNQPKKRGRPRKNLIDKTNKSLDKKKVAVDMSKQRELILHLPSIGLNSKKTSNEPNNNINDVKDTILVISDVNTEKVDSDESSKDFSQEIMVRDKIIKKLRDELAALKSMISEHNIIGSKDMKTYPLDLKLVSIENGKNVLIDKTDICCWWCTCEFDTVPCIIPERYNRDVFYVFGCFCTFNCAAAYNSNIGDYKVRERYSLLKKLYSIIHNSEDEINLSPQKEVLQKYGGKLTINEYRKNAKIFGKEYKILMPPFVPINPYIEERYREKVNTNTNAKASINRYDGKNSMATQDKNIFNSLGMKS